MGHIDDGNNNAINNESCGTSGCRKENSGSNNTTNDPTLNEIEQQAAILYNAKKFTAANVKYTKLIEMSPNCSRFYGHRAATYMMLENYVEGLKDANKSVKLDPTFIEGHCRVIKCAMKLHKFSEMDSSVAKLKLLDPTNEILQYQSQKMRELVQNLEDEVLATAVKDYTKVLEYIDKSLKICPQFVDYKVKKAECLINLGTLSEAEAIAKEILRLDQNSSDGHYVLGKCWHQTNIEKSVHHFEEAFRLNPRCIKDRTSYESAKRFLEKKTQANIAYKSQNFTDAHCQYSTLVLECRNDTTMMTTLYFNMAQASYKLGNLDRCLQECTSVLNLKPNHLKALMRSAQCEMDQKQYGKAIEHLEKAWSVESSVEVLKMLQEVYKLLAAFHNGSYVILGIVQSASKEVITKSFKELTKLHHPDRHANATEEQKKYHEIKCKEITRAYRLLVDHNAGDHPPCRSTDASQKEKSTGSFNTDSTSNNTQQSSSGSTNNNSTGSQSSSRRDTHDNGQRFSSEKENYKSTGTESFTRSSNSYNEQSSSSGYKPSAHGHDKQKSSSKTYDEHSSRSHRDDRKRRHSPSPSRRHDYRRYEEDSDYDSDRSHSYGRHRSQKSRKRSYNQY